MAQVTKQKIQWIIKKNFPHINQMKNNEWELMEMLDLDSSYKKEWVGSPEFDNVEEGHNWRNYVPHMLKEMWFSLSVEIRIVIIVMAVNQANNEQWY